ncbi:uncharacterized protein LOC104907663 [Beta vulgaris subsp. vulgaris]|uniref:uncharacterized protein LOC104907663 n=1 Tax=Beta vulgaris subsp. vulgaris TaxID=3555 RepID=UPI00053FBF82|nr:uncharacterized protein LOC104907663 [Beta vulgaris subsp. vulgaris]
MEFYTKTHQEEKLILDRLRKWSRIEGSILQQKVSINWITLGDSNSKFFFTAVKVRNTRNKITMIHSTQGDLLTETTAIQNEITSFYRKLLGSSTYQLEVIDLRVVREGPRLKYEFCCLLMQVVTTTVDLALASINDSKAPELDVFNAVFFKKTWHIIKHDIYVVVLEFFDKVYIHKAVNCTTITLILKMENALYAKDYRPIAAALLCIS